MAGLCRPRLAAEGDRFVREHRWFALILFGLACVLGALLGLLVLLAPWLARSEPTEDFWQQMLDLFARDVVVRRVSVAMPWAWW